jgi:hypothetical protein
MSILKKAALASLLAAAFYSPAYAGGAVDFLDPCAKPVAQFSQQERDYNAAVAEAAAKIPTAEPDEQFIADWWVAQKTALHDAFMKERGARLDNAKLDKEKAFEDWYTEEKANANPEEMKKLITEDYRRALTAQLARERAPNDQAMAESKRDLDSSCKKDVGSQVFRSALNVTLAPFHIVAENVKAAGRESGVGAQIIRGTTGISLGDIQKHGIFGGPNSIFRKPFG